MSDLDITEPYILRAPSQTKKHERTLKNALQPMQVMLQNCSKEDYIRIQILEKVVQYWYANKNVHVHESPDFEESFPVISNSSERNLPRFTEDTNTSIKEIRFPRGIIVRESSENDN